MHQIARQGAAVDRDKGFVAALTAVVDCMGDQLLAGAAFPRQQDRTVTAAAGARLHDRLPHAAGMTENHLEGVAGAHAHDSSGDGTDALIFAQGEHPAIIRRRHQRNHAGEGWLADGHKHHFTIVAKRHG
ncbi:hypothetical protein D3C87_1763820 [compost metagenome]